MSKEDVLLFTCYGKRGNGKSYMEHLKAKDKEIERLNNIINELEKWVKEDTEKSMTTMETGRAFNMFDILDKIKELKGER